MTKNKRNKVIALTTAVLLIVALAAMGTIAWLTATDKVDNTFTVGTFNKPDINPDNPDTPVTPDPGADLDGYLIEPSWSLKDTHKILSGETFAKDPYVGTGAKSEDAMVYVHVENPFKGNSVYFKLNAASWTPVSKGDGADTESFTIDGRLYYTQGVFRYTGQDNSGILAGSEDSNSWTDAPVFDEIIVTDGNIDPDQLPIKNTENQSNDIVVTAFLHQAKDADGNELKRTEVTAAALKAFGLGQ